MTKEIKKIILFFAIMIILAQMIESKACVIAPSPTATPEATETSILTLQLMKGD